MAADGTSAEIGKIVREERKRQRLDQRTLALISDVGVSAVHRVERGEGVRLETLLKILSSLGLELSVVRKGAKRP